MHNDLELKEDQNGGKQVIPKLTLSGEIEFYIYVQAKGGAFSFSPLLKFIMKCTTTSTTLIAPDV